MFCRVVAFAAFAAASLALIHPALADSATDAILLRLEAKIDALAKENAALQTKLNRMEGKRVAAIAPARRTATDASPPSRLPKNVYASTSPVGLTGLRAAAMHEWTGFYMGLNAGYSQGHVSASQNLNGFNGRAAGGGGGVGLFLPPDIAAGALSQDPTALTGGLQLGYNYQFTRNLVAGFEADIDSFRLNSSFQIPSHQPGGFNKTVTQTGQTTSDWVATVRGRLGYVEDRMLIFVTGGAAFTNYKDTRILTVGSGNVPQLDVFTSSAENRFGWVAGAGLEYAWSDKWSIKGEYLHLDFGTKSLVASRATTGGVDAGMLNTSLSVSEKLTAEMVRLGINYNFATR